MDVTYAQATSAEYLWSRLGDLARTNAIAANVVGARRIYGNDTHLLLTCLVAAVESNEQLLERARNLIALMPPAPIAASTPADDECGACNAAPCACPVQPFTGEDVRLPEEFLRRYGQ